MISGSSCRAEMSSLVNVLARVNMSVCVDMQSWCIIHNVCGSSVCVVLLVWVYMWVVMSKRGLYGIVGKTLIKESSVRSNRACRVGW